MTTRQKVMIVAFILVVLFLIWQVFGLFGGSSTKPPVAVTKTPATSPPIHAGAPGTPPAQSIVTAKPEPPMSQREMELVKLQQETQQKYVAALNELQMLKVSREIAETNQAIMNAKLAAITAQKGIVDMLAPPAPIVTPATYARGLGSSAASSSTTSVPPAAIPPPQTQEANYTVISVSQLLYKWSAVLGYQGNLYHISVGDVLPPDQSVVLRIDRTGVVLEKDKVKRKISLVPII